MRHGDLIGGFSRKQLTVAGLGLAVVCFTPLAAFADAIDGAWCAPDGKHMMIEGRRITTPGGAKIEGDYSRHAFSYVVPEKEPEGGSTIYMSLMNETTVQVRVGTPVAQPVVWKRCQNIT